MKYKIFLLLAFILGSTFYASSKKKVDTDTMEWRYEIEASAGQAVQGYTLVKVYTYAKKKDMAIMQAGKNAVHGVLFKGVAAKNDKNVRIPGQKPIISDLNAYENNQEFFDDFFKEGGKYQQFIQMVNNGVPDIGDIVKIGKEYKVGVKVLVAKDALRKAMENAGIIAPLGSGF